MFEAAFWGAVGASSLLIGAVVGLRLTIPERVVGLILGFGAGTLISAVTFELTEEAFTLGGADIVAIGLGLGALTYFAGDSLIERRGAADRMSPHGRDAGAAAAPASALLLGAVLDGIPESAVLGITVLERGSVSLALLAAVFLSNMPESLAAAPGMRHGKDSTARVLGIWAVVVVASTIAAGLGYGLLDGASDDLIGLINSFAAGAVLTMLADTMMPEAFDHGGRAVGLLTVFGFALAYLLSTV